jgi:uncharacterized protein (TIGR00251 family)
VFKSTPDFLRSQSDGVLLSVRLQPRAAVDQVGPALGQELKVRVTAPPADNEANQALVRLLAARFGCARNRVELLRGRTSRHKVIKLHGFTADEVVRRLSAIGAA